MIGDTKQQNEDNLLNFKTDRKGFQVPENKYILQKKEKDFFFKYYI